MTLNSSYTYLFLDFETTGLDLSSDFPIQIALIQTDHHLTVLNHYSSYISLPESITRLRSNVSYMTGIDLETITSQGKSLETIQGEISHLFGPDTILIGQNISFDIGFLKKFLPECKYSDSIDTYPLAISTIPYLKSYSLENINHHLTEKYTTYEDKKSYLLTTLSDGQTLSAHDALYDCIIGLCFISRWCDQIQTFSTNFPILSTILAKTEGEGIMNILISPLIPSGRGVGCEGLPILTSPLPTQKPNNPTTSTDRTKVPTHSKRSTKGADLSTIISELPHPCIIAVSHGSKIDIIKRSCPDVSFDYLKEEQIIDKDKLMTRLHKDHYTGDERLFVVSYLAHHRDGYRVLNPILSTHKHILDYLQISKPTLSGTKKILCSHGGLYHTIHNNPTRTETYKDYPICILDADRRHTTYNDYSQRGLTLNSLLHHREKYEYEQQQLNNPTTQQPNSTSIAFFMAHFAKESETYYTQTRSYKREIDYLLNHPSYTNTIASRQEIRSQWTDLQQIQDNIPGYLTDSMTKIDTFFTNPLKIQRKISNGNDPYYTLAPAVRYIDFAEYLKMFGDHQTLFFSSHRPEYTTFLPTKNTIFGPSVSTQLHHERIIQHIKDQGGSYFIVSHNADKSKKIFHLLHEHHIGETHTLIGEYLTGGVAKNITNATSDKPVIIIGGYHMLLHLRGEGKSVDHIIIHYIPKNMESFLLADITTYGR